MMQRWLCNWNATLGKRFALLCLLALPCLAPGIGRAGEDVGTVSAVKVVKVVTLNYPPYTGAALPGGGTMVRITREAMKRVGFQLEVEFLPWNRALYELRTGSADGLVNIWRSEEREQWLHYSRPILTNDVGLIVQKARPLRYARLEELRAYRIGTVRGYANPVQFNEAKIPVFTSETDEINLRALASGRLDAVLIDRGVGRYLALSKLAERADELTWLEPVIEAMPNYFVVPRDAPRSAELLDAFNRGLESMRRDGTLAAEIKTLIN